MDLPEAAVDLPEAAVDLPEAAPDVTMDAGPIAAFAGDWTVSMWTLTRAVGDFFPTAFDGGNDSPECARIVRDSYRVTALIISADGTVRGNGRICVVNVSGPTLAISCDCGTSLQVCSHAMTLRRDDSGTRLTGEERFDFSYVVPAYCTVTANVEAQRSRAP